MLSSGAMFVWIRKHYGVVAGLFAATLYTYAPYHSVDIYVRGALSEFFSWIWIPLIFWSIDMLLESLHKKYIVILGIFFALLMLTHTLVMLQLGPLLAIYLLFALIHTRKDVKKKFLFLGLAFSLGLGLSAYFWLPSIAEKQYTLVDAILTKELANYAIHFVCPMQLWSSPWGYGGSVAGCVDGLSFQMGKIQTIVGLLGVILSIGIFLKKKNVFPFSVSLIFLSSIFLTLPYSKFLWDFAKPFWYIQFPWRYLLFVAVGSAFLGGFVISFVQKRFGRFVAIGCAVVLSFLAIYQVRNYFHPQTYLTKTDAEYTSVDDLQWRVSRMSYEYVPKNVPTRLSPAKTTETVFGLNDIADGISYSANPTQLRVKELQSKANLKKYEINVYNTSKNSTKELQINTFLFPGWKIFIDGKEFNNVFSVGYGAIGIGGLPIGKHIVEVRFTDTPIRTTANSITLITGISLIGLLILFRKKKFYEKTNS